MRRRNFIALGAAALAAPAPARAQDEFDPASSAGRPSLRVLLGAGETAPGPDSGSFLFDGRPYRGSFVRLGDGRVVNVVGLEAYLYSVVPREMPRSWPAAALQAQAICARTFVLQRSDPRRAFDLVPSEADQVYTGMAGESPAARAAVDATAGQALRYRGSYASIAYSSCCGGHTEASSEAWGSTFFPYLQGVVCSYCTASPNYRWTTVIGFDAIARDFDAQLAAVGALQNLRITALDASGRARGFALSGPGGSVEIKGSTFRLGIGARVLRSLLISNLRVDGGTPALAAAAVIEGGGLGHGVGMCQWGARGRALAGGTARDILALYFPGTQYD